MSASLGLFSNLWGWGVEWILRLAEAGGEGLCVDIMEISKPDDLGDIANLGIDPRGSKTAAGAGCSGRSPPRRRGNTRSGGRFAPAATMFAG